MSTWGTTPASSPDQQATSNQQASRVSSTVGQDTQAIDEQAKPSLNRSSSMDPGTSFRALEPMVRAKINVLWGCVLWNAIWCGENRKELLFVTFNSTVKKCLLALYPNRSGIPGIARFSILFHIILGVLVFFNQLVLIANFPLLNDLIQLS